MKDSALRLQDKTVLLTGPFGGVTQAIIRTMTEFGASVAYVSSVATHAGKFCDGVNEAREIHPQWGRAAHFNAALDDEKQIQEALGNVTQSLGRADVLVDTGAANVLLAEKVLPFLQAKTRGRIIYVYEDPSLKSIGGAGATDTSLFDQLVAKTRGSSVSVNALTYGVTDDFLLKNDPKSPSLKKSFEALAKSNPRLKLVDFTDIAHGIVYLASNISTGVTGQTIRVTHGFHL